VKNKDIVIRALLSPYVGCVAPVQYDREGPLVPDYNGTYILHAANTYGWPTFSALMAFDCPSSVNPFYKCNAVFGWVRLESY
jgi:hypothetical protein